MWGRGDIPQATPKIMLAFPELREPAAVAQDDRWTEERPLALDVILKPTACNLGYLARDESTHQFVSLTAVPDPGDEPDSFARDVLGKRLRRKDRQWVEVVPHSSRVVVRYEVPHAPPNGITPPNEQDQRDSILSNAYTDTRNPWVPRMPGPFLVRKRPGWRGSEASNLV